MKRRYPHIVRIAVSAALAVVLVLAVKYTDTAGLTWMTNDDVSVINTLSGAGGAEPSYTHPYSVNVILTAPVSLFYRLVPALNWWLIYTLAAVCLGLTLIHYCIFTGFKYGGHKILTAVAAVLVPMFLIAGNPCGNSGEIFAQLLNICGTHLLLVYLIYIGRMPYRTVAAVLIPSMVFTILMFCSGQGQDGGMEAPCRRGYASAAVWIPSLCLALVMLTCVALDREAVQDRRCDMAVYGAVCEYTEGHTENLYIRIPGMFSNLNAAFKMTYLSGNMVGWGGSQWGSSSNRSLWEKNGITEPTAEVFKDESTYLLFDRDITSEH